MENRNEQSPLARLHNRRKDYLSAMARGMWVYLSANVPSWGGGNAFLYNAHFIERAPSQRLSPNVLLSP